MESSLGRGVSERGIGGSGESAARALSRICATPGVLLSKSPGFVGRRHDVDGASLCCVLGEGMHGVIQDFETARALALASDRSRLIQRRLGRNSLLPGSRLKLQLHTPSVPAHEPRSYDQQDYAPHAHEDLDGHSVGDLDQDDMGGK